LTKISCELESSQGHFKRHSFVSPISITYIFVQCEKSVLEFDDAWLEVEVCEGSIQATAIGEKTLSVRVVSEALEAAASADNSQGIWWYSRRLHKDEKAAVRRALKFTKETENNRSTSLSVNVKYKKTCYTLTLFEMKKSP
jgi:hypothetical protein